MILKVNYWCESTLQIVKRCTSPYIMQNKLIGYTQDISGNHQKIHFAGLAILREFILKITDNIRKYILCEYYSFK